MSDGNVVLEKWAGMLHIVLTARPRMADMNLADTFVRCYDVANKG